MKENENEYKWTHGLGIKLSDGSLWYYSNDGLFWNDRSKCSDRCLCDVGVRALYLNIRKNNPWLFEQHEILGYFVVRLDEENTTNS
jgi:hypothetical protein